MSAEQHEGEQIFHLRVNCLFKREISKLYAQYNVT